MVAVGTRISPRPPHRTRLALLTHRAPPSGQTSRDERSSVARRPTRSHHSDRRGISAQCPNRGRLTVFPLGEALPSTTSAESCLPLFSRFASVGSEEAPIEGLASVRRSNGTCSFPAFRFHEWFREVGQFKCGGPDA